MAPFTNPLRHLWARTQPSATSVPESIAGLDGINDGYPGEQTTRTTHPQQQLNGVSSTGSENSPPETRQDQDATTELAGQAATLQQYEQPPQQFAINRDGRDQCYSHELGRALQELGSVESRHNDDSALRPLSRTATVQPPDVHANHHTETTQTIGSPITTGMDLHMKEEPSAEGDGNADLFAQFTNTEYHNDTGSSGAIDRASVGVVKFLAQAALGNPSVKPEPNTQAQAPVFALEPDVTVESATAMGDDMAAASAITHTQPAASSTTCPANVEPGHGVDPSGVTADIALFSTQNLSRMPAQSAAPTPERSRTTVSHGPDTPLSFEQNAQVPAQPILVSQVAPGMEHSRRSPSADSVISSKKHSSEKTASSPHTINLEANSQSLAQQWSQRQKLLGMDVLTAEAVQANPILLHGPTSTQQQPYQIAPRPPLTLNPLSIFPHACQGSLRNHPQYVNTQQSAPSLKHHPLTQYSIDPTAVRNAEAYSQWSPSAFSTSKPGSLAPQSRPAPVAINSLPFTRVRLEGEFEAPADDKPPHHRSTSSSPVISATVPPQAISAKTPKNAIQCNVSGGRENSVIDLSGDGDGETAEPISWKLPDFEATYHPPSKADDMPVAKISIPQLVREEVALTLDHAQQEMQLFVDLFLPAQQALQKPDPTPAHAVINFHTISVMVLEAFVQYEIGDEMGRGYGFHGGNITGTQRRPSPPASDEEPARIRSAKDADVDEIFFAVIDRWRAGILSGKGTFGLIRGCQEFCDLALDIIHYIKEHGLLQPEPKKRKERSDKGMTRGPRGGAKEVEAQTKTAGKRKADVVDGKAAAKKCAKTGNVTTLEPRKKAKVDVRKGKAEIKKTYAVKKAKPKATAKSGGVTIVNSRKK